MTTMRPWNSRCVLRRLARLAVLCLLGPLVADAGAQLVQMQNINVAATAEDGTGSTQQSSELINPSFPFSRTQNPTRGGVANLSIYQFDSTAGQVTFSFDFNHSRAGLGFSESFGTVLFSTSQPLVYTLSGEWFLNGTTSFLAAGATLDTIDRSTTFFSGNNTFSGFFAPEASNLQYHLGVLEGDPFFSHLTGSLTGVLPTGDYSFAYIYSFENDTAPSSMADGFLNLTLQPVPEPGTFILFAVGLAGVFLFYKRF